MSHIVWGLARAHYPNNLDSEADSGSNHLTGFGEVDIGDKYDSVVDPGDIAERLSSSDDGVDLGDHLSNSDSEVDLGSEHLSNVDGGMGTGDYSECMSDLDSEADFGCWSNGSAPTPGFSTTPSSDSSSSDSRWPPTLTCGGSLQTRNS